MRTTRSAIERRQGLLALAALFLLGAGWNGMLQGRAAAPSGVQRFFHYFELTGQLPERISLLERVTDSYLLATSRPASE